ncbi:hypothetical protein AWC38_SpisGene10183 [Stylophora pistillata]|uniref:Uncharacterized protein n=1 Tax=Stylophora pistillata TaxID=50429 RepID=A0A2B4S9B1_STYPI|nr:hypothetical protein AWC38_SpisGene10183 [Stylophora pistillata]
MFKVFSLQVSIVILTNVYSSSNDQCKPVRFLDNQDATDKEVEEYVNYFARPTISSPLKQYLHKPRTLFALAKAAEIAVEHYSENSNRIFRLRQILDLKELGQGTHYWFHVLVLEGDKFLTEAFFEVQISNHSHAEENSNWSNLNFGEFTKIRPYEEECDQLSKLANCTCRHHGRCDKGTARISPWLAFALKTQREIQINQPFDQIQMVSAHNAFNDRADGYGYADWCPWPPPYQHLCLDLANQEFSFTDLLNMGVRGIEVDPWWCFEKMLMSHDDKKAYRGCAPWDREFKDGIKEIGQWVHQPENSQEVIRIYFEDGASHTQGHDQLINGPIAEYLGDKVLTPSECKKYFQGRWPTMKELREINKTIVLAGFGDEHGGEYIFPGYWIEQTKNSFTARPNCSAINPDKPSRVYCDSTEYLFFWNGPKETGVILDFSRYMKCGVTYPSADQVNPTMLATAVFTWAEGEPSQPLTDTSCVVLGGRTERWHLCGCQENHLFACQSNKNASIWATSVMTGHYAKPVCPDGHSFSIPHNGLEHQQLLNVMKGRDVWVNLTPYIPSLI